MWTARRKYGCSDSSKPFCGIWYDHNSNIPFVQTPSRITVTPWQQTLMPVLANHIIKEGGEKKEKKSQCPPRHERGARVRPSQQRVSYSDIQPAE